MLDAGLVAHVAFVHEAADLRPDALCPRRRRGARPRLERSPDAAVAVRRRARCVTVTVVDGLVYARSVFERFGQLPLGRPLGSFHARGDKRRAGYAAYRAFAERAAPGALGQGPRARAAGCTPPSLSLPIGEASAKVRTGPPSDDDSDDAALDVWAGVIPAVTGWGEPVASPGLRAGIRVPASVRGLLDGEHGSA